MYPEILDKKILDGLFGPVLLKFKEFCLDIC